MFSVEDQKEIEDCVQKENSLSRIAEKSRIEESTEEMEIA